ncbi:MAG: NifU family protein [Planctomycetota bacterium]|nr:NifU family protein [Planctomycetota bacterium]
MNPILEIQIEPCESNSDTCVIKTNRVVAKTPEYFSTVEEANSSPLGKLLVQIEGLDAVLLQDRIVTLLKPIEGPAWEPIAERASELIRNHFEELERIQQNRSRSMTEDEKVLFVEIQNLLNDEMNPMVAAHGGFIEVVDVKETDIFVHMGGGCQGCGMAAQTLRQGVDTLIRQKVPRVTNIHDSTDHSAGDNPFYE